MIEIINKGQQIIQTNYWRSDYAREGLFFMSWNAGACRLLVPEMQEGILQEITSELEVIISRGALPEHNIQDALELLFEDGSEQPYCIIMMPEQCDRMLPDSEQGGGFPVILVTEAGEQQSFPGKYRRVETLPCFEPWAES